MKASRQDTPGTNAETAGSDRRPAAYPPPLPAEFWGNDRWTKPNRDLRIRSITRYAGPRAAVPPLDRHDYWELAFSFTGGGTLEIDRRRYPIKSPAAWLIPAESEHCEIPDGPCWDLLWIGLEGNAFQALGRRPAVVYAAEDLLPLADQLWLWQRRQRGRLGPEMSALAEALCRAVVRKAETSTPPSSSDRLTRVLEYIHSHLGEPLEIEDLAAVAGCSVGHFQRCFKAEIGATPWQYVTAQRLELALVYLRESAYSIGEIARLSGYRDQLYFSRAFRRRHQCSPTQWRLANGIRLQS